jgi:prevent-host-death family protein
MKTISIRELHEKTGEYVRRAGVEGEILVTDHGRIIARIVSERDAPEVPYFANRHFTPTFEKLMKAGRLRGGTDSTRIVSDDRDRPIE